MQPPSEARQTQAAAAMIELEISNRQTQGALCCVELAWGGEVCDGIARRGLEVPGCPAAETA